MSNDKCHYDLKDVFFNMDFEQFSEMDYEGFAGVEGYEQWIAHPDEETTVVLDIVAGEFSDEDDDQVIVQIHHNDADGNCRCWQWVTALDPSQIV